MKHFFWLSLFAILMMNISCSSSNKDKADLRKVIEDSIKNAETVAAHEKEDSIVKVEMQHQRDDSIIGLAVEKTTQSIKNTEQRASVLQKTRLLFSNLNSQLRNTKANLDVAYDQMKRIKEFQVGRPAWVRDRQIRNKDLYIQSLNTRIQNLYLNISSTGKYLKKLDPNAQF